MRTRLFVGALVAMLALSACARSHAKSEPVFVPATTMPASASPEPSMSATPDASATPSASPASTELLALQNDALDPKQVGFTPVSTMFFGAKSTDGHGYQGIVVAFGAPMLAADTAKADYYNLSSSKCIGIDRPAVPFYVATRFSDGITSLKYSITVLTGKPAAGTRGGFTSSNYKGTSSNCGPIQLGAGYHPAPSDIDFVIQSSGNPVGSNDTYALWGAVGVEPGHTLPALYLRVDTAYQSFVIDPTLMSGTSKVGVGADGYYVPFEPTGNPCALSPKLTCH